MKNWTEKEIEFLKENHSKLENYKIAIVLKKTELSVYKKAWSLKLKKPKNFKFTRRKFLKNGKKAFCEGYKTKKGYLYLNRKGIKGTDQRGNIFEHRKIMQEHIGRTLKKNETVHHKDGNKSNNDIKNLALMTFGEHSKLHNYKRKHSQETKNKISEKCKSRFKDKKNHPLFRDLKKEVLEMRNQGFKVKEICEKYKISKRTYYNKIKE